MDSNTRAPENMEFNTKFALVLNMRLMQPIS
ncbi:hypothetical protein SAMN05421777_11613 [Fluoribacter gormanii]|uniref:Uncharacterized protein n=1 Tax=Fluoribacter gormanii TaxID=464 RepID=A0A377GG64_9GAMM|nr:hypothetical protein SAMN05421777_11613 [Fluoribacter gormanii]STO23819.1 Uncharacterised protein [Fluoribacter gormanii]